MNEQETALREGAALLRRPEGGLLQLAGDDRADFLQRMTTNHIAALRPGQAAVTVLTSPTARIVHVFTVLCRSDDLLLLPSPGEAAALARHLRGQIFFMDKVTVADLTPQTQRRRIVGPQAAAAAAAAGFDLAAASGVWQERDGMLAVAQPEYDVPGIELAIPAGQDGALAAALAAAGAVEVDNMSYHTRRIELGRPAPGYELTGEVNPLEAGLAWACAENKGCYTGQEIIARQITYDKVTKRLIGLRSATPLALGTSLAVDGRAVGVVTSSAVSPVLGAPVALGIVKRPFDQPGSQFLAGDMAVEAAPLPFVAD